MLSTYLARQRALGSTAKSLWEQGRISLLGNSELAQTHSLYKLVSGIRQLHVTDSAAAQSVRGMLSHMIPFPSLNGASCPSHLANVENLVIKNSRRSSFTLSKTNMISTEIPFPGRSEFLGQHRGGQMPKSMRSRSPGLCRTINNLPKNQEAKGAKIAYKCLWSSSTGKSLSSNIFGDHGIKDTFSSFFVTCSSGAAPDVSLNGSRQEEQFSNSSGSSDPKRLTDRTLKLHSASCYLPHPDKEETGGEDAHFIYDELAIGVADGVGGWAEHGVDAGEYARELMKHSLSAIQDEPRGSINPMRVLEKAYLSTRAKGSSTACIIALTDKGIHAVNLGDSGFIVVRDGCTIFRSPVQQHDFNFTYQLECGNASDLPSSAQVFTFPVESGDAIVAGTDGLFDNLYNNEITAVVVHGIRAGLGPQVTAQKIAALARQRAQDKNRQTPFSTAAQEAGYRYYGGKLDDITVVVSYVITAFGS